MDIKKIAAGAATAGVLGLGGLALGTGIAQADPHGPGPHPPIPGQSDNADHGGNWVEGEMSRLAGKFAGIVLVEVPDAERELPIAAPDGVVVEQVHRGSAPAGSALAARLEALGGGDRPEGDVFAFVAAEQAIVKSGRALLIERWGLDADRIVVKGYWKRNESEYHAPH